MSDEEFTPDPDDIAQWAASLRPDGAPGIQAQQMRLFLGDERYEATIAHNDAVASEFLQKQKAITAVWSAVAAYLPIYGFVGLVASVTAVIKFMF